jgi:acyl-CoA thioesterase
MDRIQSIFQGDRLIQDFGMKLLEAREGYARVSVVVEERFLNAHNIGHGVLLFAAADAAFALSVNTAIDAVGVQWSLNVFRAAKPGETVIGESRIIHAGRQSMVCELTVTAGDGRILAKGQSTALPLPRRASQGTGTIAATSGGKAAGASKARSTTKTKKRRVAKR